MENKDKKFVTVYSLCFKGVFGRNRSTKFECTREKELAAETAGGFLTEAGHLALQDELDAWLLSIKAKSGWAFVVLYHDTEASEFESGGKTQTGYIIPITQGVRVCLRTI